MADVKVEFLERGSMSTKPQLGQTCIMNYVGKLESGEEFDSSYKRNRPFKFKLGKHEVIEGWEEGVQQMFIGDKARLTIPASKGYGDAGVPGAIPPNATLIFDVELLSCE